MAAIWNAIVPLDARRKLHVATAAPGSILFASHDRVSLVVEVGQGHNGLLDIAGSNTFRLLPIAPGSAMSGEFSGLELDRDARRIFLCPGEPEEPRLAASEPEDIRGVLTLTDDGFAIGVVVPDDRGAALEQFWFYPHDFRAKHARLEPQRANPRTLRFRSWYVDAGLNGVPGAVVPLMDGPQRAIARREAGGGR